MNPRILIVDDDTELRDALVPMFAARGYVAEGADGGNTAFELISREKYSFVLTDIRMGNGDGIELIERIAKLGDGTLNVAAMSGYTDVSLSELLARGAVDLFPKPFDIDAVDLRIRRFLTPVQERWLREAMLPPEFKIVLGDLAECLRTKQVSFGRGGMFVATQDSAALSGVVGLELVFTEGKTTSLRLDARVRWVRERQTPYFYAGVGLEFDGVSAAMLKLFTESGQRLGLVGFIPLGERPRPA